MEELVKVEFIRNSPPYFVGDVAGWTETEVARLVALGVAKRVVEVETVQTEAPAATPAPLPPAKPVGVKPLTAEAKKVEVPAVDPGAAATP